jgi:colanic acid biosynthesis glycosyl transferase WcaI
VALVISTPPLLLGVSGALLRVLRQVPFVYNVQDLYPDVAIELGVMQRGALSEAIEQVSSILYRSAAKVITLSDAMAERLRAKGVASDRLVVVPNWADTSAIRPLPKDNEFAREHGLVSPFVVQYSGNVGLSQGLESALEAASLLRDLPVVFAIVGDGNARKALEQQATSRGLTNVKFIPPQPRNRLPELLASSDVGLVAMRKGVSHSLVPSKLYGILAAARPVLASVEAQSEVATVIRKFGCGTVVEPEDPRALANAVRELVGLGDRARELGQAGRRACELHFSRRVCTERYEQVLAEAAGAAHLTPDLRAAALR